MKIKLTFLLFSIGILYWMMSTSAGSIRPMSNPLTTETALEEALVGLGVQPVIHYMDEFDPELADVGEKLIKEGEANYKDFKGKRISSYFVCTDCHNLVPETNSLTNTSSEDRLDYAIKNGIPFLQGSTLHGLYNRTSFYNGDYYKKYGDLVIGARDTLENAIQLCAEYCASGRPLVDWELDAMMNYFKREELKLTDLSLNEDEINLITNAHNQSNKIKDAAVSTLKDSYKVAFSAHFPGSLAEDKRGYGLKGDAAKGKEIYESSCMYCHGNARVTYLNLDNDVLSASFLWNNKEGYDDKSIYQVIRWGTSPIVGRKQYMPLYTSEKLSDGQLEDLMAYIKLLAKKK